MPFGTSKDAPEQEMAVMQSSEIARVRVALALIALIVLVGSFSELQSSLSRVRSQTVSDDVSQYEQRFSDMKPLLPNGRIVSYRDTLKNHCKAFVLAQYSVAPAILATHRLDCGHMNDNAAARAASTNLFLENSFDLTSEPYLSRLFPDAQLDPGLSTALASGGSLFPGQQIALVKDSGHGVRLYSGDQK